MKRKNQDRKKGPNRTFGLSKGGTVAIMLLLIISVGVLGLIGPAETVRAEDEYWEHIETVSHNDDSHPYMDFTGDELIVGSYSSAQLEIYDREDYEKIDTIEADIGFGLRHMRTCPDGDNLVVAYSDTSGDTDGGGIIIYDTSDWSIRYHDETDLSVRSAYFSPDGEYISYGEYYEDADPVNVYVREMDSWDLEITIDDSDIEGNNANMGMAWHPDGSQLALSFRDDEVYSYDTSDWSLIETITHSGSSRELDYNSDGSELVIAWDNGDFTIHDTSDFSTKEEITVSSGDKMTDVAFGPHGDYIVATGIFDSGRLYDRENLDEIQQMQTGGSRRSVFSNSYDSYAFGSDGDVYIYNTGEEDDDGTIITHPDDYDGWTEWLMDNPLIIILAVIFVILIIRMASGED